MMKLVAVECLVAGCALLGNTVHAQSAAAEPGQVGLQEIVVTAQKRSENIQDVPIAITALKGDNLASVGIRDTHDLQLAVPSLNYATASSASQPFLRGIGTDVTVPSSEPSVATFVDGVYIGAQNGLVTNLLGMERVEVLAGPQGTLYGRNASGGAINIYSLTPDQELDSKVQATYGNYNRIEGSAHLSGAVTDQLAVGLYIAGTRRKTYDDYVPPVPPGQELHDDDWGVRLKAVWRPTDAIKLTGSIERTGSDNFDNDFRNVQPNGLGYAFGAPRIIVPYTISANQNQFENNNTTLGILREELDANSVHFVGISSYRSTLTGIQDDLDGTSAPVVYLGAPIGSQQYSQELQALSRDGSPISWIAGLFFYHEAGGYGPLYVNSPILFQPAPFTSSQLTSAETTKSYAAFAQTTIPLDFLTTGLRLTLGGRYTKDEKTRDAAIQRLVTDSGADFIPPQGFPTYSKAFVRFTPKVTVDYKLDSTLFYATFAQGFKSGTFNTSTTTDNNPVNPEVLTEYEAGLKSDLFDNRLRLNVDTYLYHLKDLQVQILDPTGGISAVLVNAASATAYGLEMTLNAAVTSALTLNFSGAAEHSSYTDFANAPYYILPPAGIDGPNTQVPGHSATGLSLERAPKFVATVGATYKISLSSGADIAIDGNYYRNSGYKFDPIGQVVQPAYQLENASLAYTTPGKNWELRFWGTNLANAYHANFKSLTSFGTYQLDGEPRMYGVTATWKLK